MNATCPTCRKSVFPAEGESLSGDSSTSGPTAVGTTAAHTSSSTGGEQRHGSHPVGGVRGSDEMQTSTTAVGPTHRSFLSSVFGSTTGQGHGQDASASLSARSSGEYSESTPLRANDHQATSRLLPLNDNDNDNNNNNK